MTRSDLKTVPALRYLSRDLTLIRLSTGATPEWQLHLTIARFPGMIPEADAMTALMTEGDLLDGSVSK